ncbi:MAG: hypothetical protein CMJ81_15655 [Planctomycetaceae bacterium]|nr:hypothetical protein [Planctomycetaceae bacterium]
MIEFNVGVSAADAFTIKRIDTDYFNNERQHRILQRLGTKCWFFRRSRGVFESGPLPVGSGVGCKLLTRNNL